MDKARQLKAQMFPQVLMISTGHLTARTAKWLRDHDAADWPCLGGHFGDSGFTLYVDEGASGSAPNLPTDLSEAFEFAASKKASHVIFQDVSPIVPGLTIYRDGKRFASDAFLNRRRKTKREIEEDAAQASMQALSAQAYFSPSIKYFLDEMRLLADELAAHALDGDTNAFPLDRLRRFSDLASAFRLLPLTTPYEAASSLSALRQFVSLVEDILMTLFSVARRGPTARRREVLEDLSYWLNRALQRIESQPLLRLVRG